MKLSIQLNNKTLLALFFSLTLCACGGGSSSSTDDVTAFDPVVADPVVADPVVADPVVADPVVADPVVADPVVADPVVADPVVADPVVADPVVPDPVVPDPVVPDPVVPDPANAYNGNSNKAMLTQNNSMEFVVALFGRSTGDTIIPSSYSSSAKNPKPALNTFQSQVVLSKLSNKVSTRFNNRNFNYQSRSVNQSEICYGGGSISISGELNSANIGKVTFQMNNCSEDDVTVNGSIVMNITKYDSNSDEPSEYTISFNNLSMSFQGETFNAIGTQSFVRDNSFYKKTITTNMLQTDNNGKQTLTKNFTARTEDLYTVFSGKIYLEDHGYVDVTTPESVRVNDNRLSYVGYIQLTGAASSIVKISPEFTGIFSDRHRIDLDTDGDGVFEYISLNDDTIDWNNLESLTKNKPPVLVTEIDNYQGRDLDKLWINDYLTLKVHAYDPEGFDVDYLWTLESNPNGSTYNIEQNLSETTLLIYIPEGGDHLAGQSLDFGSYDTGADVGGEYEISLKVTDADGISTIKFFNLTVLDNELPTAIIKNNNSDGTFLGNSISLESYESFDTETDHYFNRSLDIEWKIISKPLGSNIEDSLRFGYTYPTFVGDVDVPGSYVISLTVTDSNGGVGVETITIDVPENQAPSTMIEPNIDYNVYTKDFRLVFFAITKDREDSPFGDLVYQWSIKSKPLNSNVTLEDDSEESDNIIALTPDVAGSYTLETTVTDSHGASDTTTYLFEIAN